MSPRPLEILPLNIESSSRNPKHSFSSLCTLRILGLALHSFNSCFIDPFTHLLNLCTLPSSLQTLKIGADTRASVDPIIPCNSQETEHWTLFSPILGSPPRVCVSLPRFPSFYGTREPSFVAHTCRGSFALGLVNGSTFFIFCNELIAAKNPMLKRDPFSEAWRRSTSWSRSPIVQD